MRGASWLISEEITARTNSELSVTKRCTVGMIRDTIVDFWIYLPIDEIWDAAAARTSGSGSLRRLSYKEARLLRIEIDWPDETPALSAVRKGKISLRWWQSDQRTLQDLSPASRMTVGTITVVYRGK